MSVTESHPYRGSVAGVPALAAFPRYKVYGIQSLGPVLQEFAPDGCTLMCCVPLDFSMATGAADERGRYLNVLAIPCESRMDDVMAQLYVVRAYSYQYIAHIEEVY